MLSLLGVWVLVGMGKGQGKNTHGLPMSHTRYNQSNQGTAIAYRKRGAATIGEPSRDRARPKRGCRGPRKVHQDPS
jgi:hypothetical protein